MTAMELILFRWGSSSLSITGWGWVLLIAFALAVSSTVVWRR